ncbi:MAG: CHAT domain-containing protein [Pyrinomonadaceae bacterium]
MLISNYYLAHRQIIRHFQYRLIFSAFLLLFFCKDAVSQDVSQVMQRVSATCIPAMRSATLTAQYYRQKSVKAEAQHQETMRLLRQLSSLELIQCAFDVQWEFPIEGNKYPAYITEYSTLAFNEAVKTKNVETAAQLLGNKAGLYFTKNLFQEAMLSFKEFGIFFDPFTVMNVFESEDEIVRKAQLFKDISRRYARFMYKTNDVRKPLCEQNDCLHLGWEMQEKIKSRLFRAQIIRGALLRLSTTERNKVKDLLRQDNDLRQKRNQFNFASRNFNNQTPYDNDLRTTNAQIIALVPEYKELSSEIPKPEDISKVLASDETLLSFFYNDNNDKALYGWVIERDSAPYVLELKGTTTRRVYEEIDALKTAIEGQANIENLKDKLSLLQQQLIAPFNLRPKRKLIIAVDQNLSSLPFDILPWGTQGMMLDSFDIKYTPSATVFFHLRNRAHNTEVTEVPYKINYAGFSFPNTGEQKLDYANEEIRLVGSIFGSSPPNIIQINASESDLYRNSDEIYNARYLHLVTHSNPQEGITGGFYLPFAEGGSEDGQLTSYEIVSRLKNHAELVVLSACQTATSGDNLPPTLIQVDPNINGDRSFLTASGCICNYGESFSNLSGSFFAAGSKQLLLTQWLIRNDEKTMKFVKRIFDSLHAGKKPSEALRLAKQQMRDDKSEKSPPVNWAGFILAGG